MRQRDFLERVFGKAHLDFLPERLVPCFVRAAGADQQESALRQILSELLALLLSQRKILVARHHAKRVVEQCVRIQAHRAEFRVDPQAGLLRHVREKMVRETDRTLVPGVNQVSALQQRQIGMNRGGWRDRDRLVESRQRKEAQRESDDATAEVGARHSVRAGVGRGRRRRARSDAPYHRHPGCVKTFRDILNFNSIFHRFLLSSW